MKKKFFVVIFSFTCLMVSLLYIKFYRGRLIFDHLPRLQFLKQSNLDLPERQKVTFRDTLCIKTIVGIIKKASKLLDVNVMFVYESGWLHFLDYTCVWYFLSIIDNVIIVIPLYKSKRKSRIDNLFLQKKKNQWLYSIFFLYCGSYCLEQWFLMRSCNF